LDKNSQRYAIITACSASNLWNMIRYDMLYGIIVNCNWVNTRWQ